MLATNMLFYESKENIVFLFVPPRLNSKMLKMNVCLRNWNHHGVAFKDPIRTTVAS